MRLQLAGAAGSFGDIELAEDSWQSAQLHPPHIPRKDPVASRKSLFPDAETFNTVIQLEQHMDVQYLYFSTKSIRKILKLKTFQNIKINKKKTNLDAKRTHAIGAKCGDGPLVFAANRDDFGRRFGRPELCPGGQQESSSSSSKWDFCNIYIYILFN